MDRTQSSLELSVYSLIYLGILTFRPLVFTMSEKPIILHLGDPVQFNKELYHEIAHTFTVICPSPEERQRPYFSEALKEKKWGDFQAIFRPFWNTGGEMGRWDSELIPLLPSSMKVFASAGAGYDWVDVDILAKHGKRINSNEVPSSYFT